MGFFFFWICFTNKPDWSISLLTDCLFVVTWCVHGWWSRPRARRVCAHGEGSLLRVVTWCEQGHGRGSNRVETLSSFLPLFSLSEGLPLWSHPCWVCLPLRLSPWRKSLRKPQASLVTQSVMNLPALQETRVWFLGWEDPLEKEMTTHSRILAWRIPQTVQSMGSQTVEHDWATNTFTFFFHILLIGGE